MAEQYRDILKEDLYRFLLDKGLIDVEMAEYPELERKWEDITRSFLPEGVRQFLNNPTRSLSHMIYMGMAVARFWKTDWERYDKIEDLYHYMCNQRGYEHLGEYIRQEVLQTEGQEEEKLPALVDDCANYTVGLLKEQHLKPFTREAFRGLLFSLQVLYNMGVAMEMKR